MCFSQPLGECPSPTRWFGNSWINAAIIREFPPQRNCPGNLEFGAKSSKPQNLNDHLTKVKLVN